MERSDVVAVDLPDGEGVTVGGESAHQGLGQARVSA